MLAFRGHDQEVQDKFQHVAPLVGHVSPFPNIHPMPHREPPVPRPQVDETRVVLVDGGATPESWGTRRSGSTDEFEADLGVDGAVRFAPNADFETGRDEVAEKLKDAQANRRVILEIAGMRRSRSRSRQREGPMLHGPFPATSKRE